MISASTKGGRPPTAAEVREEFLAFFQEKEHTIVPSSSMVPHEDPSLLFINAGMNQFKDVFLGTGTRPYRRAADAQKCLRVSGKHNDLEEVGHDTYHHTFFEMLGNWSFGDYFKDEAIAWAWELLVHRWGMDPTRLYATVHKGDAALGLSADEEAAAYWRRHLPDTHVLYCGTNDNFWMMGETGPCGPCSEVHIDLRTDTERARISGRELINSGDACVIELWNLVFIQFNATGGGALEPLAARHVDTGMGLERLVAVRQGVTSTYDTDLFAVLNKHIADLSPLSSIRGYDDITDAARRAEIRVAMRVVADHVRAIAFAIADGVTPGNVGRAYVIRRILRRAVRYGYTTLGFREPFLFKLVAPLAEEMGDQYGELRQHRQRVENNIRGEEASFLRTLGDGIQLFECIVPYVAELGDRDAATRQAARMRLASDARAGDLLKKSFPDKAESAARHDALAVAARHRTLPGEVAFLLHDTYGFPLDLTQLMARERGLEVDQLGYDVQMAAQVRRARTDLRAKSQVAIGTNGSRAWQVISHGRDSTFLGYDTLQETGLSVRALHVGDPPMVVLDATPFYAEKGGQVGDTGTLVIGGDEIAVLDTQAANGRVRHIVSRLPGSAHADVSATVDGVRRQRICKHHTATHLLHAALREVLGPTVMQKGSLVAPGHLRFDFNHYERVDGAVLALIQQRVNAVIQRNVAAQVEVNVPIQEALGRGAVAFFGEKYGSHVRVVIFDERFSVELCGGTHVAATGELGLMLIRSEGSVAAGIRRVEAIVGMDAVQVADGELSELGRVRRHLNDASGNADVSVAQLQAENKALRKAVERLHRAKLEASLDGFIKGTVPVGSSRVAVGQVDATGMDTLRKLGAALRRRLGTSSVGVLGARDPSGGKAYLVVTVSDDLVARGVKAGAIVGPLARLIGGGGGGRPELATAGGKFPDKLSGALGEAHRIAAGFL